MVIAVVMAGGKGTRLKSSYEKPLFIFKSKPLITYVLDNLLKVDLIDVIYVAVSKNTPDTYNFILNKINDNNSIKLLCTPGVGYLEDLSFILDFFNNKFDNEILFFINADLPFISPNLINLVLNYYFNSNKPALSVMVPIEIFKKYDINVSYDFNGLVPSGVNILRSKNIIQDEKQLIISKVEFAININTLEDVDFAKKIYHLL